jgi:hypothetical protein
VIDASFYTDTIETISWDQTRSQKRPIEARKPYASAGDYARDVEITVTPE